MNEDKKQNFFKYPCVCLCVHVSQVTKMCVHLYLWVCDKVNFKSVCTQTHIWVLGF